MLLTRSELRGLFGSVCGWRFYRDDNKRRVYCHGLWGILVLVEKQLSVNKVSRELGDCVQIS